MSTTVPPGPLATSMLTLREWAERPEDEPGELVDGRLVEEEMPDLTHETVVAWLIMVLGPWLRSRGGRLVGSELRLQVGASRGRKPDIAGWFPGHPRLPARGAVAVPPDLVVEVVPPTADDRRRDRVEKAADYAGFGVRWYWLVDAEMRTLDILQLTAGAYAPVLAASTGSLGEVPGCPGLGLDLDALWAEIDSL